MFPAKRITELRNEKGISKADLAKILYVGRSSVSGYEKGTIQPSVTVLIQLATYFDVSVDYLLGRTNIRVPFNKFEYQLDTRSGKISLEDIFRLNQDEKEVIGLLLKTYMAAKHQ